MILLASAEQGDWGAASKRVPTSGLAHSSRSLLFLRFSPTAG